MKAFAILIGLALVVVSQQDEQTFQEINKLWVSIITSNPACVGEAGTTQALIDKMVFQGEFPDDKPLKCYTKCIFAKLTIINDAGEIQSDSLKKLIALKDATALETVFGTCGESGKELLAIKFMPSANVCTKMFKIH